MLALTDSALARFAICATAPDRRRRALELLASCRDGCTEALMIARGFSIAQMVELVRAGHSEQYESNGRSM